MGGGGTTNTTNYAAIGNWGWLEATPGFRKRRGRHEPLRPTLSPERRKNLLEAISLLESLENSQIQNRCWRIRDDRSSAHRRHGGCEGRKGRLLTVCKINPERDGSWNGLGAHAVNAGDFQNCAESVKNGLNNTIRCKIAYSLHKTLDRIDLSTKAIEQAKQGSCLSRTICKRGIYRGRAV